MDPHEPERLKLVRERLGRRSQVGGGMHRRVSASADAEHARGGDDFYWNRGFADPDRHFCPPVFSSLKV